MKVKRITLLLLPLLAACTALTAVTAQSPEAKPAEASRSQSDVKLAVDLVVIDAQVMQQKTGRIVGHLNKEDFTLFEDGVKQEIANFTQDSLPLSILLLVDRGGCLDPINDKMRQATLAALTRLKPEDEVAMMAFSDTVELIQGFTYNRGKIAAALDNLPPQREHHEDEEDDSDHCFNHAFYRAADYIRRAGNPDGRRVIVMITGLTRTIDCPGPSGDEVRNAILESGSVVCGLIPTSTIQRLENGLLGGIASAASLFRVRTSSLKKLAEETGGEVFTAKSENMSGAFNNLVNHLRTRYNIGFISSNAKRDGAFRKLKLQIAETAQKREGKLIVKTRRGYIASKTKSGDRWNPRNP